MLFQALVSSCRVLGGVPQKNKNRRRLSVGKVIAVLIFFGVTLWGMQNEPNAFVFIQPIALGIFLVVAVIALLTAKHGYYMSN